MPLSYEERVLKWLRRELIERTPEIGREGYHILVDDIHLEENGIETRTIAILFKHKLYPQCVFGFKMEVREPGKPVVQNRNGQWEEVYDPEGWAAVIFGNLLEHVQAPDMGLPKDCNTNDITWL